MSLICVLRCSSRAFALGAAIGLPILCNLPVSAAESQELKDLEDAETETVVASSVVSSVGDVMPTLGYIGTTYTISDTIPPPLTSLTALTTTSTLESVLNEPIMSVAVAESESGADIGSVFQS